MMSYLSILFNNTKLVIFSEVSKKYFKVVDAEDAAVADFAALAGGQYLDIAPTSVKIVPKGDTISEFQDRAVRFPYRNVDRVTAVEHCSGSRDMDGMCHCEFTSKRDCKVL